MRRLTCVVLLALVALPAAAQINISSKQIAETCQAPMMGGVDSYDVPVKVKGAIHEDPQRPGMGAFLRSVERLMPIYQAQFPRDRVIVALVSSDIVNAWTFAHWIPDQGDPNHPSPVSLICVTTVFIDFASDEDELAFFIGHEMGHTVDEPCRLRTQKTRDNQAVCEMRADESGYQLMRQAGYSPYAAAGAFGRWEMYTGDTATGIVGTFSQLSMDHPITPRRIENMRRMLIEEWRAAR
jgi:Zn-dependent protease with chaperone function